MKSDSQQYENDIFISYAHIDNQALTENQKGWIDRFHRTLEIRLQELLGENPKIWRDKKLQGNDVFSDAIVRQFQSAAILISVISPRYVKSEWCTKELSEFIEVAEQKQGLRIGDKLRTFKVVKTPVPREKMPPELQAVLGYEFYQIDKDTDKAVEFRRESGPEFEQRFVALVFDLAHEISQLLSTLKEDAHSGSETSIPKDEKYIYLAQTTTDLKDQSDKIKRELLEQGYTVLPDQELPTALDDLQELVRSYLQRCLLSIHLVGEKYGFVPEGEEKRSIVWLQNELAAEYSKSSELPRIIWMPKGLTPPESEHHQVEFLKHLQQESFQMGAELVQTSIEDLKSIILSQLEKLERRKTEEPDQKSEASYIYLICDEHDLEMIESLYNFLHDNGLEVLIPEFEGDAETIREAHEKNLLMCDAALIYYGSASETWVRSKVEDLSKALGLGRAEGIPNNLIYVGPPESMKKKLFKSHEPPFITNFNESIPDILGEFVVKIKNGNGAS